MPTEGKESRGFKVQLDSTDLTPVLPKPFENVTHHIDTAPLSTESEDEFMTSWQSPSPSTPSY